MNQLKKVVAESGMYVVFALVILLASAFVPNFFSAPNAINLGLAVATVGIVSCTMLFCLAAGDFDLSVGSNLALGGILFAMISNKTNSLLFGVLAALAAGAVIGLINGTVISRFGINALITTLAMMQIVRGTANILTQGKVVSGTVPNFDYFGNAKIVGVPMPILIMVAAFIVFGVLLNRTVFGRNTLAIGGNPEAARLAGLPVPATKTWIFVLSGMASCFAGVVAASRLVAASNNAGEKLELQAISACVLGGVSLAGGVGTIGGVVMGVLIMGIVENVMRLKNIDTFWQMVVTGVILLAAVLLDRLKMRVRN